jgi:nucleoside-diphosphate-sugar epimerase
MDSAMPSKERVRSPIWSRDFERTRTEKSPAAICRKVAMARSGETIEVWGDGNQTRSYCYIDDCVEGLYRLMQSDWADPLNLGTDRLVSINELVDIVARIAGKEILRRHDLTKPQGVRGRNSDNTRLRQVLGWSPAISLEAGLASTYKWIESELAKAHPLTAVAQAGGAAGSTYEANT